jgi:regulator of protease activity HflC (stomatin/prohibitin superfamily)
MRRLLVAAAALVGGCASHTTAETEVGVLVCTVGLGCASKGVQKEVYPPGSTNFFAPFIRDFYTFDTKTQNLRMSTTAKEGDRQGNDDLRFKTTDGSDVSMDVTVVWNVDPNQAPLLLETVGKSTDEVKEKLIRPMARTHVRDVLNELDSESIYNADKRFQKAEEARQRLAATLAPYGVLVTQVILHEHRFTPEYEKIIHDRKLAEQRAEQLKSESEAAQQEAIRDLEGARGKVAAEMAAAQGELAQWKLAADGAYYQQQQNADAILAEREATAQAIAKRNEALRGSGGRAMVKLKIAEALTGKNIVMLPAGASGMGVNRLDVNKLVEWTFSQQEGSARANE